MYLIVVGAEKEGQRFIDIALDHNYQVILISSSEEKSRQVLKKKSIRVLVGQSG